MVYTSRFLVKDANFSKIKAALNKISDGIEKTQNELIDEILENMDKGAVKSDDFVDKVCHLLYKQTLNISQFKFVEIYIKILKKIISKFSSGKEALSRNIYLIISNITEYEQKQQTQVGKVLWILKQNNLLDYIGSIKFDTDPLYEVGIGYFDKCFDVTKHMSKEEEEAFSVISNATNKSKSIELRVKNLNEKFKYENIKIKDTKSIFELRSKKPWTLYIQMEHKDTSTYDVKKVDTQFDLQTLVSDLNLKDMFKNYENITAFSLFQNGPPEWGAHKGGGRFILKTDNWEEKYIEIFEWLQSLDKDSGIVTVLSIVAGFRFKLNQVNGCYSVEVWYTRPDAGSKAKQHKKLVDFLEHYLKNKIFHTTNIRVDIFSNKKNNRLTKGNRRNGGASNRRDGGATNRRDGGATNRRDGGATNRRDGGATNRRGMNKISMSYAESLKERKKCIDLTKIV